MIQVKELSISYGATMALENVSINIQPRKITAIVGPSGCGKSSFLASLNRMIDLVPEATIRGSIRLDGEDVYSKSTDVQGLRKRVGMIFQKPNPFPMSIRRNIQLALREHGEKDIDVLNRLTEQVLKSVGLWNEVRDRLDSPATQLSGGQQQRLCIARALVLRPDVLLLDEPCSSLDPKSTRVIDELLRGLAEDYTIVLVTHHLAQARRLADQVAVFWTEEGTGKLIECGDTEAVLVNPQNPLIAEYIDHSIG